MRHQIQFSNIIFSDILNKTLKTVQVGGSWHISSFQELYDPEIAYKTNEFDVFKPCFGCKGFKLIASSFLSSWVLSHHKHIALADGFRCGCCLRHCWNHSLHHDYLPVVRDGGVAIFQQLYAMLVTPIMKYPLYKNVTVRPFGKLKVKLREVMLKLGNIVPFSRSEYYNIRMYLEK